MSGRYGVPHKKENISLGVNEHSEQQVLHISVYRST